MENDERTYGSRVGSLIAGLFVVAFRGLRLLDNAGVWKVDCLDGRERIGAAAGCILCRGFLLSERDLHALDMRSDRPGSSISAHSSPAAMTLVP
jgi:hypothetical protein